MNISDELYAEALSTFDQLFDEAKQAGEPDPTAMAVATAGQDAKPSLRMVLLKQVDERGFVFYTHLQGRKGRELRANRRVALLFYWPRVRTGVQIRIEGDAERVSDEEADLYFATRPRGSQIGAWASLQSETLLNEEEFNERIEQVEKEFEGREVPRPAEWTGVRVRPDRIEFWYACEYRLHRRHLYECDHIGTWTTRMLYP